MLYMRTVSSHNVMDFVLDFDISPHSTLTKYFVCWDFTAPGVAKIHWYQKRMVSDNSDLLLLLQPLCWSHTNLEFISTNLDFTQIQSTDRARARALFACMSSLII